LLGPPLSIDVYLSYVRNSWNCECNYRNFAVGIYTAL
jgi:hypothetical protein